MGCFECSRLSDLFAEATSGEKPDALALEGALALMTQLRDHEAFHNGYAFTAQRDGPLQS